MKKYIVFMFLIFCLTNPVFSQEYDVQQAMSDSAVWIFLNGNSGLGTCSGVVLTNSPSGASILTAKHCISVEEETYINTVLATQIIVSLDDDLAIIKTKNPIPNKKPAVLSNYNPLIGSEIYHLGYPSFEDYYREGKILLSMKDHYYAKMTVIPGCSGGGVWNKRGELVGIVWGGLQMRAGEDIAIFEPISDVIKFLRNNQ
jgi:S1-C subfamily serine protease